MDLMQIRHRLLMQEAQSPQPQTGYVTDGLVFWLDAIDHGSTAGVWTDLIGNKLLTLNNVTFANNGADFSESGAYAVLNGTSSGGTSATGTIEACVSNTARANIYCLIRGKSADSRLYYHGSSGRFEISNSNSDRSWLCNVNTFDKYTVSANLVRGYFNGNAMGETTGRTWMSSVSSDCILIGGAGGISNPASTGRFANVLHSIRIYNRQLTADEMLQNQRYDNTRFSLGLTI